MKINQIESGILEYVQKEIAEKAPNGFLKFMIYTGSFLMLNKGEKALNTYLPVLKAAELIDEEGDIDIEKLYEAAKQGIKESGSFEYKGITFHDKDVDNLYTYIKAKNR